MIETVIRVFNVELAEGCVPKCRVEALNVSMELVFEGPVSRLEKDRDRTGPRPIKTGNSQDRSGP